MFASLTSLIETGLKSMNQSDFQKLAFDFLNFKGFNYIGAPGAMVSANKTSPGTPDGFFEDNDGKFIFCEVTTLKRENNKSKFLEKLHDDIKHCFDEEKSKISNEDISTVILVFNSKIYPNEVKDLRSKVKEFNPNVKPLFYNIQNLANFLQNFPNLGNYIPFAPTMDGIYSLNSFIEHSAKGIRPDLKNEFIKPKNLFNEIFNKLNETDYLCLYGNQGTGKTRLAIEIAQEYSKINDFRVIVIKRYSPTLVSDIRKIVNSDEKVLFVIDDYTDDFFNLSYFIEDVNNLHDNSSFKYIFTLRNQFLSLIKQELKNYSQNIIPINSLDEYHMRNFIREFIKNENCSFLYQRYIIDRLIKISKGNIVFCVMAMKIMAKEEDTSLLNDSERVFINYFHNYDKLVDVFYNNELLKLLGIFSFFDVIDLNNDDLLDSIEDLFDCQIRNNSNIDKLLRYELLTESHGKIYFEDSLLSTYIFYLTFVKRDIFDFQKFIEFFIQKYPKQLEYKFGDIFASFDMDKFKITHLTRLNLIKDKLNNDNDLINFYSIFNIFYSEELLLFVIRHYEDCYIEEYNWDEFITSNIRRHASKNRMINLLFESYNYKFVLEFAFKLIYKKPSLLKDILFNINQKYSFTDYSKNDEFYLQHLLIDVLNNQHNLGSYSQLIADKVFQFVITDIKYLEEFGTEWGILHISDLPRLNVELNYDDALLELRQKILDYLFKMYDDNNLFVGKTLEMYIDTINENFSPVIEKEFNQIYSFLNTLDYKRYYPNKIAYLYKNKLNEYNVDYEGEFEFIDENIIKKIHTCSNAFSIHERTEEIEITKKLTDCFNKFGSEELLNLMNEIRLYEEYVTVYTDLLFNILIDADINEFLKTFEYYIKSKFRLISGASFIKNLFNSKLDTSEIFNLINNKEILEKEIFYHSFFLHIPKEEITKDLFYEFCKYLKDSNHPYYNLFDYYRFNDAFLEVKEEIGENDASNIIQYLTKILIIKSNEIPIFFSYTFCEEYLDYFDDNFELLKECYFNHCLLDSNYDSDFSELEVLCRIDKSFLKEYLQFRHENNLEFSYERGSVDFIWNLDYDYGELDDLITFMLEKFYPHDNGIYIFFPDFDENKKEFITNFISKNYKDKQKMRTIFEIIKEYYSINEYIEFLNLFLGLNGDCEIFEGFISAELLPDGFVNRVVYLEEKIKFYETIKKYIENLDSIKYLEHIIVMKNLIHSAEVELNRAINIQIM
ncbi:hypothetical protein [Methanobrevibacter sp.]|uniref:nSTAND3 domain-containing NTPase n=1 Tax=Methanobrevibacter sp. TaxID=66852 RepID=UPI003868844A